ncbi:MAG TPA: hypothetical protein VGF30_14260 [Bacteroidia bacterium]
MKLLPALCAILLFASCNMMKNAGFEKRRYRPGFYHSSATHVNSKHVKQLTHRNQPSVSVAELSKEVVPGKVTENFEPVSGTKSFKEKIKEQFTQLKKQQLISKLKSKTRAQQKARHLKLQNTFKNYKSGADPLIELLVTLVLTLIYYLIALCLMTLFPAMSQSTALGLAVIIMIVAIVVLAIVFSRASRKKPA